MAPDAVLPAGAPGADSPARSFTPTTKIGRWAVGLGIAAAVWGVLFPFFGQILVRLMGPDLRVPIPMGLGGIGIEALLAIGAITTAVIALARKERSWLFFIVFAAALVIGGFWLLFAAGEVIYPH